jgi:hypothetical protein
MKMMEDFSNYPEKVAYQSILFSLSRHHNEPGGTTEKKTENCSKRRC